MKCHEVAVTCLCKPVRSTKPGTSNWNNDRISIISLVMTTKGTLAEVQPSPSGRVTNRIGLLYVTGEQEKNRFN